MRHIFLYAFAFLFISDYCSAQPTYKNSNLSARERAEDLVKWLTLEEKVALMMDNSQPVERLGIKPYNWWSEALHGVARSGLATVFPQPIGMAAVFDADALRTIYTAVSDEARAKNARYSAEGSYARYQGLTMWTPTVNIYRDPRWGRGIETYGEDPYLTSVMGVNVVKGLQCLDAGQKYDKIHACAKHFAVHSGPEWNRHEFNAENIKPRDLHETYLQPFEALVKEAKVKEVIAQILIPITNTGSRDGEEVVQVYLRKQGDGEGPMKTLRAFKRVHVPAGKRVEVALELTPKQLEWWDAGTNTMRTMAGKFDVMVGGSSKEDDLLVKTMELR